MCCELTMFAAWNLYVKNVVLYVDNKCYRCDVHITLMWLNKFNPIHSNNQRKRMGERWIRKRPILQLAGIVGLGVGVENITIF